MNVEQLFAPSLRLDDNDELLRQQSIISKQHSLLSKQSSFLSIETNETLTHTKSAIKTVYKKHTALIKVGIFLLFYAVGIIAMSSMEGWGFIECVYFITVSITTVGYGYFAPSTPSSRLFMIFYLIIGVTMIISFCTDFTRSVLTACHDEIILRVQRARGYPPPNNKEMYRYRSLLSIALVLMWCFVGTAVYSGNEGWSVLDGLYWTVVTMTTVGYGDMTIEKTSTRVFGIFFIYASVLTFSVAISNIVDEYSAAKQRGQLREKLQSLSTVSFGQKWVNRLLRPGQKGEVSPSSPLTPHAEAERGDTPCARERFILYALAELGVLSFSRDIIPLAKVRYNQVACYLLYFAHVLLYCFYLLPEIQTTGLRYERKSKPSGSAEVSGRDRANIPAGGRASDQR